MFIITFLILLGFYISSIRFINIRPCFAPFFVNSSLIFILYCFAYLKCLQLGSIIILIVGALLLIASPLYLRSERSLIFTNYLSPGFITLVFFLILLLPLSNMLHLTGWDEFTHWGPHAKLVFLNNGFYKASDVAINKSYPLGSALFYYLFFQTSGFSSGTMYVAQCLLTFSPLTIFLNKVTWDSWKFGFLFFILTILITCILFHVKVGPFGTLYMDEVVGIYFAALIISYLSSNKSSKDILILLPAIIALNTFKPKLLPFVLVVTAIIIIDQLFSYIKKHSSFYNSISNCFISLSLPFASCLTVLSWNNYLKTINAPVQWQLKINFSMVKNAFLSSAGNEKHTIIINYLHAQLPNIAFLFIMLILSLFAFKKYKTISHKSILVLVQLSLFLSFIAYCFSLLLMYLFTFTNYEAIHLASINRYLGIFHIGWGLVTIFFVFDSLELKLISIKYNKVITISTIISFILIPTFLVTYTILLHNKSLFDKRLPLIKITRSVNKITPKNSKIFTIWQNSNGMEHGMLVYYLTPRKVNTACSSFGNSYNNKDVWTCNINKKTFINEIKSFDYLLLAYTDNNFWLHYQDILPQKSSLHPITIYAACNSNAFNDFSTKKGCELKHYKAYLLKIIHNNDKITFKNITSVNDVK